MGIERPTVMGVGRLRCVGKRERWGYWIPDQVRDDGEGVAPASGKDQL
ncbi:hypothetical protein KKY_564 [Pelagibacterium halotolerans B2]|uniref:Uncharacterized protein n=1 Tax=Pelagibacterium halotolerans (strain DSM 22347 / JCM 15775 / CGMCC 1.7692 / B2) TaxID=1082931 RepID=G4RBU2_PELHB|nr:hypothetical protein KKY_564 [Pelagibacterium halotolerans B2]